MTNIKISIEVGAPLLFITMKKYLTYLSTVLLALTCSNCVSQNSLDDVGGNYGKTVNISIDRDDCKLICGRAQGKSMGFRLLGIFPIISASESDALAKMYENARQRGAQLEGESVTFANTSIERSTNYLILCSLPTIRVTGDAVKYVKSDKKDDDKSDKTKS